MAEWATPDAVHSFCAETSPYFATKAIDDSIESYWQHKVNQYHWIIFDMGSTKIITKIRLYQSAAAYNRWGLAAGLTVYVTDDPAVPGDAVWDGVLNAEGWQESGAFDKNGRYVKLVSKGNDLNEHMYEFEAYAEAVVVVEKTVPVGDGLSCAIHRIA